MQASKGRQKNQTLKSNEFAANVPTLFVLLFLPDKLATRLKLGLK